MMKRSKQLARIATMTVSAIFFIGLTSTVARAAACDVPMLVSNVESEVSKFAGHWSNYEKADCREKK